MTTTPSTIAPPSAMALWQARCEDPEVTRLAARLEHLLHLKRLARAAGEWADGLLEAPAALPPPGAPGAVG